jgi:hypothetical protein
MKKKQSALAREKAHVKKVGGYVKNDIKEDKALYRDNKAIVRAFEREAKARKKK